jgi:hypothetical protein
MNCSQAKQISIVDFLLSQGIKPQRRYRNHYWYLAPHRSENNPSFVVNIKENIWYDKAEDTGGDMLDLVKLMYGTDTAGALAKLSRNEIKSFSFDRQSFNDKPGIQIKHTQPIRNAALIQYLHTRKIPVQLAKLYLVEAYYTTAPNTKQKFSLAFQNDKGGYHLRNAKFKGIASPGYFTSISGRSSEQLNVFEGVYDFLSAMIHLNTNRLKFDSIVLNSNVHCDKILPLLKDHSRINCFVDNDESGRRTLEKIRQAHRNVFDHSEIIYQGFKDFNDFLIQRKNESDTI